MLNHFTHWFLGKVLRFSEGVQFRTATTIIHLQWQGGFAKMVVTCAAELTKEIHAHSPPGAPLCPGRRQQENIMLWCTICCTQSGSTGICNTQSQTLNICIIVTYILIYWPLIAPGQELALHNLCCQVVIVLPYTVQDNSSNNTHTMRPKNYC